MFRSMASRSVLAYDAEEEAAESGIFQETDAGSAYDRVAYLYDQSYNDPKSLAEDRVVFQRLIEGSAVQGRVLDVGCGTGILLEKLPIGADAYVGLDPSVEMLKIAKKRFSKHTFVRGTASAPNLAVSDPFDSVVSLYGSFSYELEPERAIEELSASMLPGGRLFLMLCTPVHARRQSYIMNKVGIHVERRFYTESRARALLSRHFTDVEVQGFGRVLDKLPLGAPEWLFHLVMTTEMETLGRVAPDRCCYLIVTATRRGER